MSRKRDDRRKKQGELARQLGVSSSEVKAHHHLQENERVTRPELRLVELRSPSGVRALFAGKAPEVVVAVYVVETNGTRLLGARVLEQKRVQLARVSYTRPAHFVIVAAAARDPALAVASFEAAGVAATLDGRPLSAAELASAAWESPRVVALGAVAGVTTCAVLSVRGVGRSALTTELTLDRRTAVVELKL